MIVCCSTCSEITGLGAVGIVHWSPGVRVLFTPSLGSSDCNDGQQPALGRAVRSSSHPVHQPLDSLVKVRIGLHPHWTPWSHSGHVHGLPSDHRAPWSQSRCLHISCEGLVPADLAPSLDAHNAHDTASPFISRSMEVSTAAEIGAAGG